MTTSIAPVRNGMRPAKEAVPILIADDDERNLFSLRETLSSLDVEIVCAASGRDVLREVLRRNFAIILLDARMPEMDGYEIAAMIREREKSRHIPLIFLTAVDKEQTHIFRGYSAGAVDYVFKPVDPFILRTKVSVFLELYRQSEQIRRQVDYTRQLLDENMRTRQEKEEYAERLQLLSRQLLALQDTERRNLARELHDEIGQCLIALKLNLKNLVRQVAESESQQTLSEETTEIIDTLMFQVRNMSLELHPTMLEDFGLEATLNWYFNALRERTDLTIDFRFNLGNLVLALEKNVACYRIVQGAMMNVLRHSQATSAWVSVDLKGEEEIELVVADNGVGFDPKVLSILARQGKTFGLMAMRERALQIGGGFEIDSAASQGAVVRVRLPLDAKDCERTALMMPAEAVEPPPEPIPLRLVRS